MNRPLLVRAGLLAMLACFSAASASAVEKPRRPRGQTSDLQERLRKRAAHTLCQRTGCSDGVRDPAGCCPRPVCPEGQSIREGTRRHCCWGGQTWSVPDKRCTGNPTCPDGYTEAGMTCLATPANNEGGFGLFQSEVTVGQYRACVDAGACSPPDSLFNCNWPFTERATHPVNCVDFRQAEEYCRFVGARLPTEAEWAEVATLGATALTPWGGEAMSCDRANLSHGGTGCGGGTTRPVCERPNGHSPVGHCDLTGNVWEWTTSVPESRPTWRTIRGGSWLTTWGVLASRAASSDPPTLRSSGTGFRCLRPAPRAKSAKEQAVLPAPSSKG